MGIVDEFFELKEKTPADLLAMQVGDFYEFFAEDARVVNEELGLQLSEKSSHGSSYAMAGVPVTDLSTYLETLVNSKGYTVAVADQFEENGSHCRRITRCVTPGTIIDTSEGKSQYLASVVLDGENVGLSLTDIDSGKVSAETVQRDEILEELSVHSPAEVLLHGSSRDRRDLREIETEIDSYMDTRTELRFTEKGSERVREHFGDEIFESVRIDEEGPAARSVSLLLEYIDETAPALVETINRLTTVGDEKYVAIDARTRRSLEISDTISRERGKSLLDVIDTTRTSGGLDRLNRILHRPLTSVDEIEERQEKVRCLVDCAIGRQDIRDELEGFPNLLQLSSRTSYETVKPTELVKISRALGKAEEIRQICREMSSLLQPVVSVLKTVDWEEVSQVREVIDEAVPDEPKKKVGKGVLSTGFSEELDEVSQEYEETMNWFRQLEERVKEEFNLTHVTVDRNKTDGYYIQVGKSEQEEMPRDRFDQVKKLKNSVRFKSDELREKERELIRLEEKLEKVEKEAYERLLSQVQNYTDVLKRVGNVISEIDAFSSLAVHSVKNDWVMPEVTDSKGIDISGGRHPVVEQTVDFIPNDTWLSQSESFLIVTGPNMSGKSTYLRQTALITLLAQCGSFVPADEAQIGTVDAIFTRVGAQDEISTGRSTFMVEMSELANILNNSTDKSLVVLDEVGRGTSTSDGISISRATIEFLAGESSFQSPLTMFATHFHELTELEEEIERVRNVHVEVEKDGEDFNFVRRVQEGAANASYGVKVADIAGVPKPIIERSRELLSSDLVGGFNNGHHD